MGEVLDGVDEVAGVVPGVGIEVVVDGVTDGAGEVVLVGGQGAVRGADLVGAGGVVTGGGVADDVRGVAQGGELAGGQRNAGHRIPVAGHGLLLAKVQPVVGKVAGSGIGSSL